MTVGTIQALATQQRHMDILEDRLLDALEQLKKQRKELEEIMTIIVKDNREIVVNGVTGIVCNDKHEEER